MSSASTHVDPQDGKQPVVVATHGHCFDGMASAVMFTHLLRSVDPGSRDVPFLYRGQTYDNVKGGVDATIFYGTRASAILDFRYTSLDELTWYFDHHASAFTSEGDRAHFASHTLAKGRGFYEAKETSCTKLIADVSRAKFGVDVAPFEELVRWADIIDSARFPTPEIAVDRTDPEMKLLAVVEQEGDDKTLNDLVQRLLLRPLSVVAREPDLVERYVPLDAAHRAQVERIRAHEKKMGPVLFVDLLDEVTETVIKFVTYADAPECPYSVVASRSKSRCKVSVGYNPWCKTPRRHEINAICERFGGGGHAVVGAISLPFDIGRCREIALEIVGELSR